MTTPRIIPDPRTPLRVAIVGYGLGGSAFHAPIVAATPGMRVAAIVTGNEDRARQAASAHPDAEVVPSVEALWARADALDLVVVTTPNRTHAPLASAALAHALPVVVDKPFARTPDEGRAVIAEARARGLLLTVYQNRRWDGDFLTLRRLVDEGTLGAPFRLESRFERWRPALKGGWRERGAPEEAGGLLYDIGSHLVDQALVLFGPVAEVEAEMDRRRPGAETDDDVFVALTHRSGVRSHLHISLVAAEAGPRFRLLGARGAFVKHGLDVQEEALRSGRRPDTPGWGEEPPEGWGRLTDGTAARAVPSAPGRYQDFYAAVARSLREGVPPPVDPMDAVAGLVIIDAARRSAAERRIVRLDPSG